MGRPRIALFNASYDIQDTRRNFRRELASDLAEFSVSKGEFPDAFDFDGVVITGSKASVYWDEPWIAELLEVVDQTLDTDLPHMGVCFGHQVLAEALGGEVEAMGEYEIGYRPIHRVGRSGLLAGLDDSFLAFTSHSDVVSRVPPGARMTAENEYGVHGFEHDAVFTIQSHPEFDLETARSTAEAKDLPDDQAERVLAGITSANYAEACRAKRVFDNFVTHVHEATTPAP